MFARLPIARPLRPMLGGLAVGAIGLFVPEAYGTGWGWLQRALDGQLVVATLALVVAAKIVTTSLTVGSGGSGGVFGPTLFIGGMLGALVGYGGAALAPAFFPNPAAYVLVGMASFFAGVASAPIGALLMVAEMSGGYVLLPPLMLVSVLAILLARGTLDLREPGEGPLQLARAPRGPDREPARGDARRRRVQALRRGDHGVALDPLLARCASWCSRARARPCRSSTKRAAWSGWSPPTSSGPCSTRASSTASSWRATSRPRRCSCCADDDLYRAHELFRSSGCPQLPVVEPANPDDPRAGPIVGMLDYRDMMRAYERELAQRREA